MPTKATTAKAQRDLARGKRPSTAAGEFVHEELEHIRRGKHGARSAKQAIAIGLSEARRAGVPLPPPPGKKGKATKAAAGSRGPPKLRVPKVSPKRSAAAERTLKREPHAAASHEALSKHARKVARGRKPGPKVRRPARTQA